MYSRATLALVAALIAGQAQGFGGSIAIGLGHANEIDTVKVPFTAAATIETEEHTVTEQIYYSPGKLRDEMSMGGQKMIIIQRYDLNKTWTLMPQRMFMESMLDDPADQVDDYRLVGHEVVGREVVNGEQTTKHKVIYETSKGRYGGFTWFTDDNIAIKAFLVSESEGEKQRIRFEMANIHRAPQPDALFELPAGYTQINLGGMGAMSGLTGGMTTPAAPAPPAMPGAVPGSAIPADAASAAQQACLDQAVAAQQNAQKKKKRFGSIASAGSRLLGRFGGAKVASDVQQTQATVDDAATIANELGLDEADVQRCMNEARVTKQ